MKTINKDKPERHFIVVGNVATVSISKETPVVYAMNGTRDGFDVVKPSSAVTAGAADYTFAGVPRSDLAASKDGQVIQVYGPVPHRVTVRLGTRAGSAASDSVASVPAAAIGAPLILDTVNNCFVTLSSVGAIAAANPRAFLMETLAGVTASIISSDILSTGSTHGYLWYGTSALLTTAYVFLRAM